MFENGSSALSIRGLPREFRDWFSEFCKVNGIEQRHLIEALVLGIVTEKISPEAIGKLLEETLRRYDPDLYAHLGPWRNRRHEIGLYGIWVRVPKANGQSEEAHVAPSSQVAH